MSRETLERIARDLAAQYRLSPEEWKIILVQAEHLLAAIAKLDELPLDTVEPAATYRVGP